MKKVKVTDHCKALSLKKYENISTLLWKYSSSFLFSTKSHLGYVRPCSVHLYHSAHVPVSTLFMLHCNYLACLLPICLSSLRVNRFWLLTMPLRKAPFLKKQKHTMNHCSKNP
jgi:hypothetical protein